MSVAQQFLTFLVDQLDAKVGDIEQQTASDDARVTASEAKLYVAQLRQMIPQLFDTSAPVIPVQRASVQRRRRSSANGEG